MPECPKRPTNRNLGAGVGQTSFVLCVSVARGKLERIFGFTYRRRHVMVWCGLPMPHFDPCGLIAYMGRARAKMNGEVAPACHEKMGKSDRLLEEDQRH